MCGLVGYLSGTPMEPEKLLPNVRRMGLWQAHRGPDDWGEWAETGIALGHNRLAILDVHGGSQPMVSADGQVAVIFNGEIYNYRSLWQRLEGLGHTFRSSHADTEVILEGYREWGTSVFDSLAGMYAIAIWDKQKRLLTLARDEVGIKPLYYGFTDAGDLVFASEPKALTGPRLIEARLRPDALAEYLLLRAPLGPSTMLEGVTKVPPGHFLEFSSDLAGRAPKAFSFHGVTSHKGPPADDEIEEALRAATTSHLMSDVGLGTFLSGGVDSTLLLALAAETEELDAFTISTDSKWDEAPFARAVANHLGIRHHVRRVSDKDFLQHMDDWTYANDDPSADPSALALMLLTAFCREKGMTVMLAGEGADELFGGYNAYLRFEFFRRLAAVPGAGLAGPALRFVSRGRNADYAEQFPNLEYLGTGHLVHGSLRDQLLDPGLHSVNATLLARMRERRIPTAERLRSAMLFDQAVRLPDDLLMRTDRATMYFGLEGRVPMLDRHVVALANRLPDKDCVRLPRQTKIGLKRMARRHIPNRAVDRPKRGFDLPIGTWLRREFAPMLRGYARERNVPGLDYDGVDSLLTSFLSDTTAKGEGPVWAWLTLERWHEAWCQGRATPRVPEVLSGKPGVRRLRELVARGT